MTRGGKNDAIIRQMISEGKYYSEIAREIRMDRSAVGKAARRMGIKERSNGHQIAGARRTGVHLGAIKDPDLYVGEVTYPDGIKFSHSADELRAMCREALAEIDGGKE